MAQTVESALAEIRLEHGLQRIDIGAAGYGPSGKPYLASIWFDAPEHEIGHAAEWGATCDEAVEAALATMRRKLASPAPLADAA